MVDQPQVEPPEPEEEPEEEPTRPQRDLKDKLSLPERERAKELRDWIYCCPERFREAGTWLDNQYGTRAQMLKGSSFSDMELSRAEEAVRTHPALSLNGLVEDARAWEIADLPERDRHTRCLAILVVYWLMTDPDAHNKGLGICVWDRTPFEGERNAGRKALREYMLASERDRSDTVSIENPLRGMWMRQVEIAWIELGTLRHRDTRNPLTTAPVVEQRDAGSAAQRGRDAMGPSIDPGDVDHEEFELFEAVKAHVIDPAHREQYRDAVEFLDKEYSEDAIQARRDAEGAKFALPSPPVPKGCVPVAPDPLNATYRRLGAFFGDALKWILPDLVDDERIRRARAILYVAWITSDPSAHQRGVGLSEMEQAPWDDPQMQVLGRRWSKMLAMDGAEGWRARWIEKIRIASTILFSKPDGGPHGSRKQQRLPVDPAKLKPRDIAVLRYLIQRADQAPDALNSSADIANALSRRGTIVDDASIRRATIPVLDRLLIRSHKGYSVRYSELENARAVLAAAESQ